VKLETLFAYVLEAEFAVASAGSRVDRRPWGAILVAPEYPQVHDANMAWVEGLPPGGTSQVLLELDSTMRANGISYRHLEFANPEAAVAAHPTLVGLDYRPTRAAAMVRLGSVTCIRNPDLEVREVDTPAERDVFDAVLAELFAESKYSAELSRQLLERIRARSSTLKEVLYLGLFNDEGAGTATLIPREKLALIDEVGTRPKFRRRGVARTVVDDVADRAQAMGLPYVGLVTGWDNTVARTLYESLGYKPVGEIRGFQKP
jgi:GNAT superfamily N-acetyltransferase